MKYLIETISEEGLLSTIRRTFYLTETFQMELIFHEKKLSSMHLFCRGCVYIAVAGVITGVARGLAL